jgi:HAMP domain-containing protein
MRRFLSGRSLVEKIVIPIVIIIAMAVGMVWSTKTGLNSLGQSNGTVVNDYVPHLIRALKVSINLNQAAINLRDLVIETDREKAQQIRQQRDGAMKAVQDLIDEIGSAASNDEERKFASQIQEIFSTFGPAMRNAADLAMHDQRADGYGMAIEWAPVRKKMAVLIQSELDRTGALMQQRITEGNRLEARVGTTLVIFAVGGLGGALLMLGWIAVYQVARPLTFMTGLMERLAKGDLDVSVTGTERADEIGSLARSLEVFKNNSAEMRRLEADQASAKERAEAERRAMVLKLAGDFESSVGGIVGTVASASTEMQGAARSLSTIAETDQPAGNDRVGSSRAGGRQRPNRRVRDRGADGIDR